CYAQSDDGIHWRRPELEMHPWKSKPSNIILAPSSFPEFKGDAAHTAVFKDANPACLPAEKYKMVAVGHDPHGIYWLGSPDGIHFSPIRKTAFLTGSAFDSQNVAFFDVLSGVYRSYHRAAKDVVRDGHHREMMTDDYEAPEYDRDRIQNKLVRWTMTSTSKDLYSFSKPEFIEFPGSPIQELYTNTILPYYRAPHIFMGFPARYVNRGWSEPVFDLPGLADRLNRAKDSPRYGPTVTDTVFMSSRDGRTFKRWEEAFIRPGPREKDSWVYGDNFTLWGMVETKSAIEDAPNEISMYSTEGYWQGESTSFRRLTLRLDGFVSAQATYAGGEILTKPICFKGGNLSLNLETSTVGGVQVEIQDVDGKPIDGYALADCPPIYCDRIAQVVRWNGPGGDVRPLSGKPVRLRFVLKDADLYSFQFTAYTPDPKRPSVQKLAAKNRQADLFSEEPSTEEPTAKDEK
ncbi:hypothetical protein LCGC14_1661540, partial [marine sediment metagenome]